MDGLIRTLGSLMVTQFERANGVDSLVRRARRKYLTPPPPPALGSEFDAIMDKLPDLATQESVWKCLDEMALQAQTKQCSPAMAVRGLIQDIEDGWAAIETKCDDFNVEIMVWDGEKYVSMEDQDDEKLFQLVCQYRAEFGVDADGPTVSEKVIWAVLKARPFEKSKALITNHNSKRVDIAGFSLEESVELAKEQGFALEMRESDGDSECWRSAYRRTTGDDMCLLIRKSGFTLISSQLVKYIADATNSSNCCCWKCTTRRAQEKGSKKKLTLTKDDLHDSSSTAPMENIDIYSFKVEFTQKIQAADIVEYKDDLGEVKVLKKR